MAPTNTPPAFTPDNISQLQRFLEDGDKRRDLAKGVLAAPEAAKAALASAEKAFSASLDDKAAAAVLVAANRLREAAALAVAVEKAGGPDAIRREALNRPAAFAALAIAYDQRARAINQTLLAVRKALAARRAELTEAGANLGTMEGDPHVLRLRSSSDALQGAANEAKRCSDLCRRADYSEGFDHHLAMVTAPLPTFPELPSLQPVTA